MHLSQNKLVKDEVIQKLLKPISKFLDDNNVTEVAINRSFEIWVKTLNGWEKNQVIELTNEYLKSLANAIIVYNGIQPKSRVSVVLPGGQRGEIVSPPAVIEGTHAFTIRKHSHVVKTLEELNNEGAFNSFVDVSFNKLSEQEEDEFTKKKDFKRLETFEAELLKLKRKKNIQKFLKKAVLLKRNIVIAGKTHSGKTTFARSLIEEVPYHERIITIEDVHELILTNHPNRIHMIYGDGTGRISADECITACMRLSPDRIFLAELRGNEAWEYLNSLNTGHPGSITTTHANNALQTFERIATLIKKSDVGRQFDIEMIKRVLHTTIDIVLFFKERKLAEVFYDPIFSKSNII